MEIGEFVKSLILQLPNFAGLVLCVVVLLYVIIRQQDQIERQQKRIDELCNDDKED